MKHRGGWRLLRMLQEEQKKRAYKLGITLEAKACKLLFILYGLSNDEGYIDTSLSDLNVRTGMSVTTIRGAMQELVKSNLLEIEHNVGVSASYRIRMPEGFTDEEFNETVTPIVDKLERKDI
jgi:hypothetical protein